MNICSGLNSSSILCWRYIRSNISSSQRRQNISLKRTIISVLLFALWTIILLQPKILFFYENYLPEGKPMISKETFFKVISFIQSYLILWIVFENRLKFCHYKKSKLYFFVADLPGWERSRNRSISYYISPDENTAIIEPQNLCVKNDPILLLIVIISRANNFELRYKWN